MAMTAQDVFTETVRPLPAIERIRLAALILQELAQSNVELVDHGDVWSKQDQKELTAATLLHAEELYPEEAELL